MGPGEGRYAENLGWAQSHEPRGGLCGPLLSGAARSLPRNEAAVRLQKWGGVLHQDREWRYGSGRDHVVALVSFAASPVLDAGRDDPDVWRRCRCAQTLGHPALPPAGLEKVHAHGRQGYRQRQAREPGPGSEIGSPAAVAPHGEAQGGEAVGEVKI